MSRNLGNTSCAECEADHKYIRLEEEPRPITKDEAGVYFNEFSSLIVAKAICTHCHTLYLAWVIQPSRHLGPPWGWTKEDLDVTGLRFMDLSYRNSFDDEPDIGDLPLFKVITSSNGTIARTRYPDSHLYGQEWPGVGFEERRAKVDAWKQRKDEAFAMLDCCRIHPDCVKHPDTGRDCRAERLAKFKEKLPKITMVVESNMDFDVDEFEMAKLTMGDVK